MVFWPLIPFFFFEQLLAPKTRSPQDTKLSPGGFVYNNLWGAFNIWVGGFKFICPRFSLTPWPPPFIYFYL